MSADALHRAWQGFNRGRRGFRRWRRGRPFWGGLFLMLGGLQLFLSTQLSIGDMEISFGPQGFLAVLLPVVLLLCGILLWVTPQHRYFYSIIGTLTAVYSLLGLNLGGWFLGMLLGIIGGALGFSWTPVAPQPPAAPAVEEAPPPEPDPDDERPTEDLTGPLVDEPPNTSAKSVGSAPAPRELSAPGQGDQTGPVRAPGQEPRSFVAAALPLLLTAALAAPSPVSQICLPLIFCPEPTPTPTETPVPGPTPTPTPGPTPTGEPGPTPTPPTEPGEEPTEPEPDPDESELPDCPGDDPPQEPPVVAANPALMTADRLEQLNFRFDCITELPTGGGGRIEVMRFSFSRAEATNFSLTTTGEGQPARVTADPLVLAGDVKFYTDRFTGNLFGTVPLELTPDSPVTDLLDLVEITVPEVFFTNVDLNLVFTNGAQLTATGFVLSLP